MFGSGAAMDREDDPPLPKLGVRVFCLPENSRLSIEVAERTLISSSITHIIVILICNQVIITSYCVINFLD